MFKFRQSRCKYETFPVCFSTTGYESEWRFTGPKLAESGSIKCIHTDGLASVCTTAKSFCSTESFPDHNEQSHVLVIVTIRRPGGFVLGSGGHSSERKSRNKINQANTDTNIRVYVYTATTIATIRGKFFF